MALSPATAKWHGYRNDVARRLQGAGFSEASSEALLDLDAEMFRLMRSLAKGELPAQLMSSNDQGLEQAQFQALTAVLRLQGGIEGRAPCDATVGGIAAEMNLDPSRASRIVADLIAAGMLRRDVSQTDGRKTVLILTDRATAVLLGLRDIKWTKSTQVFAGWSEDEITSFTRLFQRYTAGMQAAYPTLG